MAHIDLGEPVSRRRALAAGAGGIASVAVGLSPIPAYAVKPRARPAATGGLPEKAMEAILEAQGTVTNGVLSVSIDRTDIANVTLRGVPIKPSFEVNGDISFQPLGHGLAFLNGDLPLKADEVNPFIDAVLAHGLQFQAEHQHFYDFDPPVWFIHFRGTGHPLALARAVRGILRATATPLPQKSPANPPTPFNKHRLKRILRGYDAQVGEDGVVTVFVARRDPIYIAGVRVLPEANIATNIAFQPLDSSGSTAAAAPDFAMEAREIGPVMRVMRQQGWDIGCLYNQETDEHPQLFFSHQFKTGDPYRLAQEIRSGLDRTNSH